MMTRYKFLVFIYLIAVLASTIANSTSINVQNLYRVPLLNIRWIDVAILLVIASYLYSIARPNYLINNNSFLISFCFIFLIFETYQLIRTWQVTDTDWQIAGFLCTLSVFIIIDLSTYQIEPDRILRFVKNISIWGSLILVLSNAYLLYQFSRGNVNLDSSNIRVSIDVIGNRETVYTEVLTPLVYAFGIYFSTNKTKFWVKIIYISAIISILLTQVILFHRGMLFMIGSITVYFLIGAKNILQTISKIALFAFFIAASYLVFGKILHDKGYDPVAKLIETVQFAVDIDNPDWDKGRHIPIGYALNVWKENIWFGVGYDDLHNYGLPKEIPAVAHNFVVTSLFHRGIIGTTIYLLIIFLLFGNSIRLWKILNFEKNIENGMMKLLIIVSFLWLIPFWTQAAHWEKYSLSVEFMYLGFITNYYKQIVR